MGTGRLALNVYLESSAALRDVLEGADAGKIRSLLSSAEVVATSRLTMVEVSRVLARLRVLDPQAAASVAPREADLARDSELWVVNPVDEEIWMRCSRPFPVEPVRTMDAIHLATIERLTATLPDLVVLSTDERIRANVSAVGLPVRP